MLLIKSKQIQPSYFKVRRLDFFLFIVAQVDFLQA